MADQTNGLQSAQQQFYLPQRPGIGPPQTSAQYAQQNADARAKAKLSAEGVGGSPLEKLIMSLQAGDAAGTPPKQFPAVGPTGGPTTTSTTSSSPGLGSILAGTVGGIGALGTLAGLYKQFFPNAPSPSPTGVPGASLPDGASSGDFMQLPSPYSDPGVLDSLNSTGDLLSDFLDTGGRIGSRGVELGNDHTAIVAQPDEFVVKPEPARLYEQLLMLINNNAPPDQIARMAAHLANQGTNG